LETKALASGLPHRAIREQIALSVNLVVHLEMKAGHRHVAEVAIVKGLDEQGDYNLHYLPVGRVAHRRDVLLNMWKGATDR
jgi:Flp pilus assembly CpaF family ATPase